MRSSRALVGDGDPASTAVIHMQTLHLGPEELLVAAKIAVGAKDSGHEVAARHRRRRAAGPRGRARSTVLLYLEPDIDRGAHRPDELRSARCSPAGERPAPVDWAACRRG